MSSQFLTGITKFFSRPDMAVDLGTANTRLFVAGKGLIADVPTAVRLTRSSGGGSKRPDSRLPQLNGAGEKPEFTSPLRGGVVIDAAAASQLLKCLVKRAGGFDFRRPRVLICAPTNVSGRERAALVEAARLAGLGTTAVIPEPLAAAVGTGLDICSPYAQMLVDLGYGVTDIAVIREGNLIQTGATQAAAGFEIHNAIKKMVKARHRLSISEKTAEELANKLGAVNQYLLPDAMKIGGTDDLGRKISVTIESREVAEAIAPVVRIIVAVINRVIREMAPQAGAEVVETGICLTGGVALLTGIAEHLSEKTNLPVVLANSPLYSVIDGAGRMLETAAETNLWQN